MKLSRFSQCVQLKVYDSVWVVWDQRVLELHISLQVCNVPKDFVCRISSNCTYVATYQGGGLIAILIIINCNRLHHNYIIQDLHDDIT